MISRVTQQTMQRSTLANLQLNLTKMSTLQQQMSSGKRITKPSDDPSGISSALTLRAEQRATPSTRATSTTASAGSAPPTPRSRARSPSCARPATSPCSAAPAR